MNRILAMTFASILGLVAVADASSADPATLMVNATPHDCPATKPNGDQPPASSNVGGHGGYGNEYLWTTVWMWGEDGVALPAGDGHISADGGLWEMKWAWYRYTEGQLTITGYRLDGDAPPLEAYVPDGYRNSGFQVSGITFPTVGCWEVTGTLDTGGSLTFVVEVKIIDPATPVASPT